MAILKGIGGSCTGGSAKGALNYVGKKATLTFGLGCSSDYQEAYNDFQNTKEFYQKENGRQYLHYVQSFKEGEIKNADEALELTKELCEKIMPDNEVFLGVHTDKKHIHCHIIVNSVSYVNGYKFQCGRDSLEKWKEIANEINKEHGLEIPVKSMEQGKIIAWKKEKYISLKNGIEGTVPSDSLNLVNTIITVAKNSQNKEDFINQMENKGYLADWKDHKKNITFTVSNNILVGKKNKFRLSTLEKTFNYDLLTREGLENEFIRQQEKSATRRTQESINLKTSGTGEYSSERSIGEISGKLRNITSKVYGLTREGQREFEERTRIQQERILRELEKSKEFQRNARKISRSNNLGHGR